MYYHKEVEIREDPFNDKLLIIYVKGYRQHKIFTVSRYDYIHDVLEQIKLTDGIE